jgi:anti-sigma factor RsiW
MRTRRREDIISSEITELAALADGSLPPERRAAVEARVAASRELADLLADQQRAVTLAREAAAAVDVPATLRGRVERW